MPSPPPPAPPIRTLSVAAIEAVAPDQASLKAALGLVAPRSWSDRQIAPDAGLIWGACQGSGANPYRVAVDLADLGAKCTCPSRKFPCKHALALMLQYAEAPAAFSAAAVPEWVAEWRGRRRGTAERPVGDGKSLAAARSEAAAADVADTTTPADNDTVDRREADRSKRAAATRASVSNGLAEMEGWILDQLRTGLGGTLADLTGRCRLIAARLVDAKAATLAARIDGIAGRVLALPPRQRGDALVSELGKLVILSRAWAGGDCGREVWREIVTAETREALVGDAEAPRHAGAWEVLAAREEVRRDGLIARATWLLGLDPDGPRFAVLLDFYPASARRQGVAFDPGEQFEAELVFYPGAVPLRAQILTRRALETRRPWPPAPVRPMLDLYAEALTRQPWLDVMPLLLPPGRFAGDDTALWWLGRDEALPLIAADVAPAARGVALNGAVVLWNARQGSLLAADTALGPYRVAG